MLVCVFGFSLARLGSWFVVGPGGGGGSLQRAFFLSIDTARPTEGTRKKKATGWSWGTGAFRRFIFLYTLDGLRWKRRRALPCASLSRLRDMDKRQVPEERSKECGGEKAGLCRQARRGL